MFFLQNSMPSPQSAPENDQPVIIKKYANRRLYDTESSSYITLEHLSLMTRAGREFKVVDAKSGDDITHNVLTQIIVEEENRGTTLLPVSFLRQLIAMYGTRCRQWCRTIWKLPWKRSAATRNRSALP